MTAAPPRHRAQAEPSAARRSAGWAARGLAWCVTAVVAALLMVGVVIPKLGGATTYTILTGSMRPGLPPGTLIVVRPVDPRSVGIGDIVTYQLRSGEPTVVTHRVIAVSTDLSGHVRFRTQGDANPSPDAEWVQAVQLRGRLWYAIPQLGRVSAYLSQPRRVLTTALITGLLGYAAYCLIGSAWTATRRRRAR